MKKVISMIIIMIALLIIMSSALKAGEENKQIQTVIKEESGNTDVKEESINVNQTSKYKATKGRRFIDTLQVDKLLENLPEQYEKEVIFEAKWGNGEGEYAVAGESPPVGPSNLYVDERGNIYIWDGGNEKIVEYNKKGELKKEYKLPKYWMGSKSRMIIKADTMLLGWIGVYLKTGEIVRKQEDKNIDKNGKDVSLDWYQEMYNKTKEIGLTGYSSLIEDKKNERIFREIKEKDTGADEIAVTGFLDIDSYGNYYLLSTYWISAGRSAIPYAKDAIYKYSPDNELLAIIDVPEATMDVLWGQVETLNYYIDGNGDVYVLLPKLTKDKRIEKGNKVIREVEGKIVLYKYSIK